MDELEKTNEKPAKNTDESELLDNLNRLDQENPSETAKIPPNCDVITRFRCPDFVINFLADKPIKIQEMVICSRLSPAQKEKVRDIFKPHEDEISIYKDGIRELIGHLCSKYPEMIPYFSTEAVFFATFTFGFYERNQLVKDIIKSEVANA